MRQLERALSPSHRCFHCIRCFHCNLCHWILHFCLCHLCHLCPSLSHLSRQTDHACTCRPEPGGPASGSTFWRMDENGCKWQRLKILLRVYAKFVFHNSWSGSVLPGSHPFVAWIYFKTWSFGAFTCLCYPQDLQKSQSRVQWVKWSQVNFASQTTTKWIKMTSFTSSGLNIQKKLEIPSSAFWSCLVTLATLRDRKNLEGMRVIIWTISAWDLFKHPMMNKCR